MQRTQGARLMSWLETPRRKPLILRGARQVGKSTLARDFALSNGLLLQEINLEEHQSLSSVISSNNADKILQEFQIIINRGSIPQPNSLLFIDEIQAIPAAIEALRYLAEKYPKLPIIAAGSLLEFTLSDHNYSMPVGRVEYLFLAPLTFDEFILAAGERSLFEYLKSYRLVDGEFSVTADEKLRDYFRLFCLIGGMPEAVELFLSTRDFSVARRVQGSIVSTYRDDFAKYAKGADLSRLHRLLDYVSISLGEKIKFSNVDPDSKAADLKNALFLLHRAQVVELAYHSSGSSYPLRALANFKIFKPYYLDCGLISYILGATAPPNSSTLGPSVQGKLAELFVAQHLLAFTEPMTRPQLFYWLREGKGSKAEVDFLLEVSGLVIPIEVKSGAAGALKSLHRFMAAHHSKLAVRFYAGKPELTDHSYQLTDQTGQPSFKLLSLPFYLVTEIQRLVSDL